MAARVSARDLGGPPPAQGNMPYRKSEKPRAVKKRLSIENPMATSEELKALMDEHLAQFADITPPMAQPQNELKLKRAERRRIEKEQRKLEPKADESKQVVDMPKPPVHASDSRPAPTPKPKRKRGKKAKRAKRAERAQSEANNNSRLERLKELRIKHGHRLAAMPAVTPDAVQYLAKVNCLFDVSMYLTILKTDVDAARRYALHSCDHNPLVVNAVLSEHIDTIHHFVSLGDTTEYGEVVPAFKTGKAVHPQEGEFVDHAMSMSSVIEVKDKSGKTRNKVVKSREVRPTTKANLEWYEKHTPIGAVCNLMITSNRTGARIVPLKRVLIKEGRPVMAGNLAIAQEYVTQQVLVPVPDGKDGKGYGLAHHQAVTRQYRSQKKRRQVGHAPPPHGPVSLSWTSPPKPAMEAANDDSPPWDDTPPPPTAVVGDVGFMEEVARQRAHRQRDALRRHYLKYDTGPKLRAKIQHIRKCKDLMYSALQRNLRQDKVARFRRMFMDSMAHPNYHWGHGYAPKQPNVEAVTHDPRRVKAHTKLMLSCPPIKGRLHRSGLRYWNLCLRSRWIFRSIFKRQMVEQSEFERYQEHMKSLSTHKLHDSAAYDQWFIEAEARSHRHDVTHYDLQMHLLNMEQRKASRSIPRGLELFTVTHWEHIELRLGRVAKLDEARRKRRYEEAARVEREEALSAEAESLVTGKANLSDSLSSGELFDDLGPTEREAVLNTLSRHRGFEYLLPGPVWSKLKKKVESKVDVDMIKNMFDTWAPKGEAGIILPPDKS